MMNPAYLLLAVVVVSACTNDQERLSPPSSGPPERADFGVQGASIAVENDVVSITPRNTDTRWAMRTTSLGGVPLSTPRLVAGDESATLVRGDVEEWYRRAPRGLQHGYTLHARPAGGADIRVEFEDLQARPLSPDRLGLYDAEGALQLAYEGLRAWDSTGTALPVALAAVDGAIRLHIDDGDASYPVFIDPLVWVTQSAPLPNDLSGFFFADAVALQGDTAFISAPYEGSTGRVYVMSFIDGLWTLVDKLVPSTALGGDHVGLAIDVDGDRLVLGGPGINNTASDTGGAWIYERSGSTWAEHQQLLPAFDAADNAGSEVAISGNFVAIGAGNDDDVASGAGAVYMYRRDSNGVWALEIKLLPPDGGLSDHFGRDIALEGDTLAVASADHDSSVTRSGAVYVYRLIADTWTFEQKLEPTLPLTDGRFGADVALDGGTLLIGQTNYALSTPHGTATLWVRAPNWTLDAELPVTAAGVEDAFGSVVALQGDTAVVSSTAFGMTAGRVTAFRRETTWAAAVETVLTFPAPFTGDMIGHDLALDGGRLLVGAPGKNTLGNDEGQAFIFALVGGSCSFDSDCGSGICADGVCCTTPCDGGCARCDAPGNEGTCVPRADGDVGECSPELCDGASLTCPACGGDGDCIDEHYCDNGTCLPRQALGVTCTLADACTSGLCVDGVCCDDVCTGQCSACDVAGSLGTCTAVIGAPHGEREACGAGYCDAETHVAYGDGVCAGGLSCQASDVTECSPYACGPIGCRSSCNSNADCIIDGDICQLPAGICVSTKLVCDGEHSLLGPDGETVSCLPFRCSAADQCYSACTTSAQCADSFICDDTGSCVTRPTIAKPSDACTCATVGAASETPRWWLALAWLTMFGRFWRRGRAARSADKPASASAPPRALPQ